MTNQLQKDGIAAGIVYNFATGCGGLMGSYKKSVHFDRGVLPANTTDQSALTFFMGE